jgi:FkbM family methyltransferase
MNILRKIVLKTLKVLNFNMTIKHHYTKDNLYLNSYLHKGYWFHGKHREFNTIKLFYDLINKGDFVLEIGGHIGYFTQLFRYLVGEEGKVEVFEPSAENLIYLERNSKSYKNIKIVKKGAGNANEELTFYIDPITGQNNSFVPDFEGYYYNRKFSGDTHAELKKVVVPVVKLDDHLGNDFPRFIKIDVEGFEWNVVMGLFKTIETARPNFMIEIQKDQQVIIEHFLNAGYSIMNERKEVILSFPDYQKLRTTNIFFISE